MKLTQDQLDRLLSLSSDDWDAFLAIGEITVRRIEENVLSCSMDLLSQSRYELEGARKVLAAMRGARAKLKEREKEKAKSARLK